MNKVILNERRRWNDQYEYGRIRLYDHTSWILRQILNRERLRLYIERKEAREQGIALTSWNREINHVTQILDEVNRLRVEKDWTDDEPEPSDDR